MRLKKVEPNRIEYTELNDFNDWILSIGNGTIKSTSNSYDDLDSDNITLKIPKDLLIQTMGNKIFFYT